MPGSISFHLQITHENKNLKTEFFIFHRLIDEIVMLDQ